MWDRAKYNTDPRGARKWKFPLPLRGISGSNTLSPIDRLRPLLSRVSCHISKHNRCTRLLHVSTPPPRILLCRIVLSFTAWYFMPRQVPMSVVYRKDIYPDGIEGKMPPCMLYGYGSYGHSIEPGFDYTRCRFVVVFSCSCPAFGSKPFCLYRSLVAGVFSSNSSAIR